MIVVNDDEKTPLLPRWPTWWQRIILRFWPNYWERIR